MNDVMELVLAHAKQVLGERGQAAPVDDHTIRVTWAGGGDSGVITLTRSSSTTAEIGELQVLIS